MEQTWRWFGPADPIPLAHVRQAGATGVVTALHHVPIGAAWTIDEIERRKAEIEAAGLTWSVVESLPVSEDIKTRSGQWRQHLDAYRDSLGNLARSGIRVVCYNFMPVMDWTRTELAHRLPDGALALRFDATAFAAFDLFILRRPAADADWAPDRVARAEAAYAGMDEAARARLTRTIVTALPGAAEGYTLTTFRAALARYDGIDAAALRENLAQFLRSAAEVTEAIGIRLCIHPDDPPRPLLGLPRVVGTAADIRWLLGQAETAANGLTFCTGSYGVRADNDLSAMTREFAARIHFVHLHQHAARGRPRELPRGRPPGRRRRHGGGRPGADRGGAPAGRRGPLRRRNPDAPRPRPPNPRRRGAHGQPRLPGDRPAARAGGAARRHARGRRADLTRRPWG